jgi:tetratricopeptide (TPR) repeat protein
MRHARLLAAMVALAAALGPREGESCGPFFMYLRFSTAHNVPPNEWSTGHPGVLRPGYERSDLLLAYRILAGVSLGAGETPAALSQGPPDAERTKPWLDARKQIPGLPAKATLDADKKVPGGDYQFYPNCLADAFENAAATLTKRVAQWGAASPQVAEWVKGQDQVFANCAGEPEIPEELESTDKLLIADRRYQIAAAEFYAEQYEDAISDFDQIAEDSDSPWHSIAPYLAARACIRMATIGGEETLDEAAERLRAIVADPSRKQLQKPAQELLDFVRARTEPAARLVELGNQLMQPNRGPELSRVLEEYTKVWRRMDAAQQALPAAESEVAAWIDALRSGSDRIAKWRERRTLPWLVAAMMIAPNEKADVSDLLAAAHAVSPGSPGYASVTYYGILRQIRDGKLDEARRWADEALATKQADSAMNLFRAERLKLASGWPEFLRFATRKPVAMGSDIDDWETELNPDSRRMALDEDAVRPLNRIVPLKLWMEAARSDRLTRVLQSDVAQAGWVRAAILGDATAARDLAQRTAQLKPELSREMRAYTAETDPAAAKFLAVFLMLRAPGLEPTIRAGQGRETPVMKQDLFRDNWWPAAEYRKDVKTAAMNELYPDGDAGPVDFLPQDQRAAGEAEWKRLVETAGNGVNFLCAETIAWARAHPDDARIPQALHLAVDATHYGPADKSSSAYSRQAFDLLHRRYPTSEWTRKTPYWY